MKINPYFFINTIKVGLFSSLFLVLSSSSISQTSTLVSVGTNGKLVYTPDSKGNTLPDFSDVGYMNSEAPIPNVPVVLTVFPIAGDNLANVQNAINTVAAMPLGSDGFRGAILFKAGTYNVSDTIKINTSGIVLKGEGFNGSGTNFIATKTSQYALFYFAGNNGISLNTSTTKKIKDTYVPFGTKQITVASGHSFVAGNNVMIHRIPKDSWIKLLKMDSLSFLDPAATNWTASAYDLYSERKIKAVNGNVLTLDAPIMDIIDTTYATGEVMKYTSARTEKCGIENMRISSTYTSATDENHGWEAVTFYNTIHGWAKNLEVYYFGYSAVHILDGAAWITVDSCKMYDAKSIIDGGRRYSFNVDGQRCLVKNCVTRNGRHDYVNGSRTCGPVVFYNCSSTLQLNDIGPHHRWSTGILFDNITGNGKQDVQNRTTSGSGHGWAGAQVMFWNCKAARMAIQDPQGDAINWAIGAVCPDITNVGDMTTEPLGFIESQGTKIAAIPSLFIKQLSDRLNILPIHLSSFIAQKNNKTVLLKWTSNNEINFDGFEIEYSTNATDFIKVGFIKSQQLSTENRYTFNHTEPQLGLNYYRLKMFDKDGKTSYSNIEVVNFSKTVFVLKSNVVKDFIEVYSPQKTNATIVNIDGKVLMQIVLHQTQKIDVSNLSSGVYFIKVNTGEIEKFIKN